MSRIWVLDPDGDGYLEVPYRTLARPPISAWEQAAAGRLRELGRAEVDENALFAMVEQMRQVTDAVLAELRSGLLDAADTYRRVGLPADAAAEAAIAEYGHPGQIAAAFLPELTITHARRVALTLLASGPVIGLLWAVAALGSRFGIRLAPPWQWAGLTSGARLAVHLAAAAFLLAALTSLATVAATCRLTRWLPYWPRVAAATVAIAGFGTAAADLAVLALLASQLLSAPSTIDPAPVTAAAVGSLIHITLARRAARRCPRAAHT